MREPYAYSNDAPIEEKKYLQLYVSSIIHRNDARTELAWTELTEHHLFRGNDTMMVLERFFYDEGMTIEELKQDRKKHLAKHNIDSDIFEEMTDDELYEWRQARNFKDGHELHYNMLSIVILEYLENDGYDIKSLDQYDGILLNITW